MSASNAEVFRLAYSADGSFNNKPTDILEHLFQSFTPFAPCAFFGNDVSSDTDDDDDVPSSGQQHAAGVYAGCNVKILDDELGVTINEGLFTELENVAHYAEIRDGERELEAEGDVREVIHLMTALSNVEGRLDVVIKDPNDCRQGCCNGVNIVCHGFAAGGRRLGYLFEHQGGSRYDEESLYECGCSVLCETLSSHLPEEDRLTTCPQTPRL
jgi:hypothetical protein